MNISKDTAKEASEISGKWVSAILNIADRYGIDRNSFINHCTTCLVLANAVADFTNYDISTPESKVTE